MATPTNALQQAINAYTGGNAPVGLPVTPAPISGYNPWQQVPGISGQPYYNPFNPGLGHNTDITSEIISQEVPVCEEGYILDEETNTCVPVEVMREAIERGDRDDFPVPTGDGKGGYVSFKDLFDGGGAGWRGRRFDGLFGGVSNKIMDLSGGRISPHGSKEFDKPGVPTNLIALSEMTPTELAERGYIDQEVADDYYNPTPSNQGSDDNDGPSHQEILAAHKAARTRQEHKAAETGSFKRDDGSIGATYDADKVKSMGYNPGGRKDGGLVYMNTGGSVPLPGAVPTNPDQMAVAEAEGMAMAEQQAMAQQSPVPAAPAAPPGPPPRKSFAERVMETRQMISGGQTSVPTAPAAPMMGQMDAQGDGPVMIHPEAGAPSAGMVGPDMGIDTYDAELEEGSMVLNPEASEMFGEELRAMMNGGTV